MNTPNNLSILSRIIFSKILSSGISPYVTDSRWRELEASFLSEAPESQLMSVALMTSDTAKDPQKARWTWSAGIVTLDLKWVAGNEQTDPDGNVWQPHNLKIAANFSSASGLSLEEAVERAHVAQLGMSLLKDLRDTVPDTVLVMTLDNDARNARDKKLKYDADCFSISRVINGTHRELRRTLRLGGRERVFRASCFENMDITPGTFEVTVNEGPKSNPSRKTKTYRVLVPSDLSRYGTIRRIA